MPSGRRRKIHLHRNRLRISEVHADAVQRRRSVERISGRDERAIRPGEENAARATAVVSQRVWIRRRLRTARESLWSARQLRSANEPRDSGADQEVRVGESERRCDRRSVGRRDTDAGISLRR